MALTENDREEMLEGLLALRRLRAQVPSSPDLERGIAALEVAIGRCVPQRTAARALGIKHPELSHLITSGALNTEDTAKGRAQVRVDSLVERIESEGLAPREQPEWKRRRAERADSDEQDSGTAQGDLERIMKLRALAHHRAIARNLDGDAIDRARQRIRQRRAAGELESSEAERWEELLERPLSDVAARITDLSPAGDQLRESSPFTSP